LLNTLCIYGVVEGCMVIDWSCCAFQCVCWNVSENYVCGECLLSVPTFPLLYLFISFPTLLDLFFTNTSATTHISSIGEMLLS